MADELKENAGAREQGSGAAAPTGGLWVSILEIFTDPLKVFARIDAGLSWWKPYVVVSVVTMVLGFLMIPMRRRLIEIGLQGQPEEQVQRALEGMDKFGAASIIGLPILLIITAVIVAALAHLLISMMSSRSSFKKTLSLIFFCGFITLLEQVIGSIIIKARGLEAIESASDLEMSFSLAPLFPGAKGALAALMKSLGIFQIWYYVVLILGIAMIFKMSRKQAIIPAIPIWLLSFLVLLLGAKFGGGMR
jgi:hypothetical protein